MQVELADIVAIVTGAGRGCGAAIAHTLAAAGAKVAVNDINPDRAEHAAAAIRAAGGQAIAIPADVANKFQCVHLVETTRAQWGRLDILVNNAAVKPRATILNMDEWDWQRTLDVNLKGVFFMSQLVGRVMTDENQERGGVIINIASDAGAHTALENYAAYAASKAAVIGFTYECAREFAGYNIRVNVLSPAENPTPTAAAIAQMALFLCTDMAAHLSGVNLPVNGR